MNNPDISIIIVNYKSKNELFNCVESINASKIKLQLEIIVVDNDESVGLKNSLLEKFPQVDYIKAEKNLGFGGGNNLGAKNARGKYLFFLNPDTLVFPKTLDLLFEFLEKNKKVGIVSPLILNEKQETFKLQGYRQITPLNSLISFTPLKFLLPKKTIFEGYLVEDWDKDPIKEVEAIYGAALMISKNLFEEVNGFDESFFLYFEENDICKKVRNLGYSLYINSNSKIIHKVGQSTKHLVNSKNIYEKSRYLFLKKHYGFLKALIVSSILKINKTSVLLLASLITALYVRTFNISNAMQFIGDQGWFYLSARDLLIHGTIPLVGIASSHVWLHQGPLWTYLLSIALFISKFNPVGGAYLTAAIGVLTTYLMYKIGSKMFSQRIGLLAAVLYSVSPLIVFWERIPFDPSVIPFFTLLYFFALYKWIKGSVRYFAAALFLIAMLYNLELATFTLFFPFLLIFLYGIWKNKSWVTKLKKPSVILFSLIIGLIPMLPVIIYDFSHGFKQTIVFLGWTVYKPFSSLLHVSTNSGVHNFGNTVSFLSLNLEKLILFDNLFLSVAIFFLSIGYLFFLIFKKRNLNTGLLALLLLVSILGVIINQTPSDAYLPILFPFVVILVSISLDRLLSFSKLAVIFVIVIVYINLFGVMSDNFKSDLSSRIKATNTIISLTKGQSYNLIGKGPGSQFESFTMNYEYLLWWKGSPPSKSKEKIKVYISEDNNGIHVRKREN